MAYTGLDHYILAAITLAFLLTLKWCCFFYPLYLCSVTSCCSN